MTVERYNTPNHPRWSSRTNAASAGATTPQQRHGRLSSRRDGRRPQGVSRSGPPLLQSRDATEDDTIIELRNTRDRAWITAELPNRSLDEIHVSVCGASIRIQAEPSDASPGQNGIERTITLAETVNAADVVIAYSEPTLTVIVPNENR